MLAATACSVESLPSKTITALAKAPTTNTSIRTSRLHCAARTTTSFTQISEWRGLIVRCRPQAQPHERIGDSAGWDYSCLDWPRCSQSGRTRLANLPRLRMSMRQDATTDPDFEPLVVAVRAYAVPQSNTEPETASRASRQKKPKKRRDPHRVLMIDTETTVDASQRLNFGSWRYYVDRPDGLAGAVCVEEGLLFADDLPDRDPDGFEVLRRYVESHRADVFPGR